METDTSEKTEQKTETDSSKQTPFHEHPDWQKMIKSRNDANTRSEALEKKITDLETKATPEQQKVINLMAMEDEALTDMIVNDPKQYTALVAQQLDSEQTKRNETVAAQKTEAQQLADRQKGYADFFSDKPDGIEMVADKIITKYMDEHPGNNPISAYLQITGEAKEKERTDAAVEKAVKESEKIIYSTLKKKGIAASPATSTTSSTKDVKAPKVNTSSLNSIKKGMAELWRARQTG